MKNQFFEKKIVIRLTLHFILQQLIVMIILSLPGFLVFVLSYKNNIEYNYVVYLMLYFLYAIFYGYYYGLPLMDIIQMILNLKEGNYNIEKKEKKRRIFSSRIYKEMYETIEVLADVLRKSEEERKQFELQKAEWAAGITHDLNTPLTYIKGYSDMLLIEEYDWSPEEKI